MDNNANAPKEQIKAKIENKEIFSWEAPERPVYTYSKKQWRLAIPVIALLIIYLVIVKQYMMILVLASVGFLYYILTTVKPKTLKHSLTRLGIFSEDKLYAWESILYFWFTTKGNYTMLYIETNKLFPKRLIFIIPSIKVAIKIYQTLIKYIPYRVLTGEQSWYQRSINGQYLDILELIEPEMPKVTPSARAETSQTKS